MQNTFMEKAMEANIESWRKVGYPIPEAYKNWCIEHGREDLLGEEYAPSAEPATEADMDAMIDLAIEQMARDLGVEIPTKESMPGELLSMEEIFAGKI